MVLQCMIPARAAYKLENVVTIKHIDVMCKFILATGTLVGYAYCMELFIAWFSGNPYEWQTFKNRAFNGDYTWAYWVMMTCNLFIPQVFWIKWCRQTPWFVLIVVTFVNVGMWYERFVIIVQSLHHDFLPGLVGAVPPDVGGLAADDRRLRPVLHLHAAVHPVPADDRDRGGEGRAADGEPAPLPPR